MYQISSRTGRRHKVEAEMSGNQAAVAMLRGLDLPVARCGKADPAGQLLRGRQRHKASGPPMLRLLQARRPLG
jgi:hypothetical protein